MEQGAAEEVLPRIIQGGMGVGVSSWKLASTVSRLGQLGVVSGTALDCALARRLQLGDLGGNVRRALSHFPIPDMAQRIVDKYWVEGGKERSMTRTGSFQCSSSRCSGQVPSY